jgi:phage FluMu protein Com
MARKDQVTYVRDEFGGIHLLGTGRSRPKVRLPRARKRCPHCHRLILVRNFTDHLVESHSNQQSREVSARRSPATTRPMTQCPRCKSLVRQDRLERHRQKVHSDSGTGPRKELHREDRRTRRSASAPTTSSVDARLEEARVRESDHEPRFGGKCTGLSARDSDGTFGSTPLHDDYGDESDSE